MFNFTASLDEVSIRANFSSTNGGTPNFRALFGDWWAVAVPDAV